MPKYVLATGMADYDMLVQKLGVPFVAKGLESAQGAEIFLISGKEDFEELKQQ